MVDEKKFESLFRSHYVELCRYAYRYLPDRQACEDIVQGFFVALWEKGSFPADEEGFRPYAFRAVYNRCLNYYKSEAAREHLAETLAREDAGEAAGDEDETPALGEVRLALGKLPPQCKRVFLLKCVKGLKYKEIASVLGISANTVKYHLGEAFRILREELKPAGCLKKIIFYLPISYPWVVLS